MNRKTWSEFPDKPAWLDRILQVTATTRNENSLQRYHFGAYFRINVIENERNAPLVGNIVPMLNKGDF